ncbi:MAG: type IV pilus secretin PilQ, partial [Thermodesulfobacteriota bacterium]
EAVPEEAVVPFEEKEAVQASNDVRNIEFKKMGDKGYLTIETSNKPLYALKESADGKTLVIDISDTSIGQELTRTLDATKLATPVATVSSYQRSTRPGAVRVFVELSAKAEHSIREFNNTLTVVFSPEAGPSPVQAGKARAAGAMAGRKYTGQRIDLDMMDANITDILRLLAEVSDLNIIASDDVKGTISLRLKNVPWDQAFDIILKSKGLDKIKEGNVVRVAPAAKISQERESTLAAKKAHEKLEPLSIKFMSVNYAKASELVEQVKTVLTDRGSVTSETRTNTLVIRDTKRGIDSAVNLVSRLDTAIPQVLIEARIVEASTSFARDLGIQWGVDYQTGGNVSTDTFGSSSESGQSVSSSTTDPTFSAQDGSNNYAVNLPASGEAGTLGALGFILGKAGQNPLVLDLRLSAGEQEGSVRTISRPRVVSMDNKEAKIEQGESIPFETTSATGTTTTFVDANLSLTVTPHITPDGSIIMNIKASRNSIGSFRTSSGEPSIDKKESSTEVLVKDGETTVIGGIVVSDKSETDSGIPYLRKIPLFGWLFKSKSISDSQKELLIFITPTIIKDTVVS